MKIVLFICCFLLLLSVPVSAAELEPPQVPESGEKYMPPETESFSEGLLYVLKTVFEDISPSVNEAAGTCLSLICLILLVSVLSGLSGISTKFAVLSSVVSVGVLLLSPSNSLICLAADTVKELSQYGKLLIPAMTASMAAQGLSSSSAAIYSGSVLFCSVLTTLLSNLVVPMIYIYLCLSVACAAVEEDVLKSLKKFVNWLISWSMKIVLYVFSGFMGITKIVSGSVDASALRATKLTISGMIPVVGKIISDSSEAILVGAGIVKNGIGIYGLLAIIAVIVGPFLRIGIQHLLLKLTASLSSAFGTKKVCGLIMDFSKAMAMLLGMIGTMGLMLMISTVCFMKGVS